MTLNELILSFNFAYKTNPEAIFCTRLINTETNCLEDIEKHQALTAGAYLLLSVQEEELINIWSLNEPLPISFTPKKIRKFKDDSWLQYPLNIFKPLVQDGAQLPTGLNIFIWGNIPDSSEVTAQELLQTITAYTLDNQFGTNLQVELPTHNPQLKSLTLQKWSIPDDDDDDD